MSIQNMPYVQQSDELVYGKDKNYTMEVTVGRIGSQTATTITVSATNKSTVTKAAGKIHKEVSKMMKKSFKDENISQDNTQDQAKLDKLYHAAEFKLRNYVGKVDNVRVAIKDVLTSSEETTEGTVKEEKPTPPPLPPFSGNSPVLSERRPSPKAPTHDAPRRPKIS